MPQTYYRDAQGRFISEATARFQTAQLERQAQIAARLEAPAPFRQGPGPERQPSPYERRLAPIQTPPPGGRAYPELETPQAFQRKYRTQATRDDLWRYYSGHEFPDELLRQIQSINDDEGLDDFDNYGYRVTYYRYVEGLESDQDIEDALEQGTP